MNYYNHKLCGGQWRFVFVIALIHFSGSAGASPVVPLGQDVLTPFDCSGVTLDDGRLKTQFETIKNEYLSIANDDLLRGFRQRAGFAAPGNELADWYHRDIYHIFGQIIGGLSRIYAATGDQACREKVNDLVAEWAKCIDNNGYFYYSTNPNAPHYTYEKMVGGLVDAHHYCGNMPAIECLSRITDWAIKHLDRTKAYSFTAFSGSSEWYTLSENLYRAYLITGDTKYKEFAAIWEYRDYWDRFVGNGDIWANWAGGYHAYSHVNALNGAGAAYLIYGERHYLDSLVNAYDYFKDHQQYATGGYGPNECLQRNGEDLVNSLMAGANHFETQCGSWAAFKMVRYLMRFTGDARFGDWAELLTYNGIGASIPPSPEGVVQYWSDYSLYGGAKVYGVPWSCCAGTRPQAAVYHDLIWFKDGSNLYVNLYTPSTVHWDRKGKPITVSQKGVLEEGKGIEFVVATGSSARFGIKFRVPGWISAPMMVVVNGNPYPTKPDGKHWLTIERKWQNGDRVWVQIPMSLYAKRLEPSKMYPAAIMYGPVVLAGALSGRQQASKLEMNDLSNRLETVSTDFATFCLKADKSVVLRPFYAFGPKEEYFMYIAPNMLKSPFSGLKKPNFIGEWHSHNLWRYSNGVGSSLEGTFDGRVVKVSGFKFDDAGIAEIAIDGKVVGTIDQYAPCRQCDPFDWAYTVENHGEHTFSLRVTGQQNRESRGVYINVRSVEVIR